MIGKFTRAALVFAALATGAIGATAVTPTSAAASGFSVQIGSSGVQVVNHHGPRWRSHRDRGGRHHARPRNQCSAQQAVHSAGRLGLNRARVVRADRRAVVVQGRQRGQIKTAHFAQARGCPLIAFR